jgi:ACDE family multidrug resistance protein
MGTSWSWTHPFGTASRPNERLAIAISVGAMGTLGFAVTSPILPDLATELDVSRGSIGLVQAAVSVPGVLFSAVIGYLADRTGRRRVVLTALLLFSAFGCAGFFARSFWGLIGVRFLQGVGTSGILGVGIVLIGDIFEGDARTRAMGLNITGVTFVAMLGPVVSSQLAAGGIFRSFLIFLIGFPLFIWASRMPTDKPTGTIELPHRHVAAAIRTMRDNKTIVDYLGVLIATLSGVFVLHGLGLTVTPLFLDEEFGTPVSERGFILAAFQAGTILVAVRIGTIVARVGAQRALTFAFWMMAIGAAFAGLAPTAWAVAGGLAFAGLGFGLFMPQAQSYAATAAGDRFRGVTVLLWVTVVRTAQVVGPPTGSFISDRVGGRTAFFVAAVGMAVLAGSWRPVRHMWHSRVGAGASVTP